MSAPDPKAAIWAEWNALPDDERSPVHAIAAKLGVPTDVVAATVYPPDQGFGRWSPDQEPLDLEDEEPPVPDNSGRALLVTPEGYVIQVDWPADQREVLPNMTAALDCQWVEMVGLGDGVDAVCMWVDEDGKRAATPRVNLKATALGHATGGISRSDVIVGRALLTGSSGPHTVSLTDEQLEVLGRVLTGR